ncbi:hypothetical protein PV755_00530 [Streptomyces caniscabiei]|uniref:hypothetical protein n=1 Tax=Streptomyces caniscabiei TaxID=2746961 RepID=UPI0029AA4033|nr:hypothetical protein [Streptomyces caniscabiei]MDX3507419.1 hypothetical protein [Streptomyces caniscabiei]
MNLIELALTTYTEGAAAKTEQTAALAEEARVEFLAAADSCAHGVLNSGADSLDWRYTTTGLPEQVEEARTVLVPGRPEYLRYRVDHTDSPDVEVSFDLVRPCLSCGHDRVDQVTSLFRLGQLLHEPRRPAAGTGQETEREPGALAALDAWDARAARVSELARRLIAEHPDAGLAFSHIVAIAYTDGDGSTDLHLTAASALGVRQVAAALGAEVTSRHTASPVPHGVVLEHVTATARLDTTVNLTVLGYSDLTDDEAAAWRAQQNQDAEAGEGE